MALKQILFSFQILVIIFLGFIALFLPKHIKISVFIQRWKNSSDIQNATFQDFTHVRYLFSSLPLMKEFKLNEDTNYSEAQTEGFAKVCTKDTKGVQIKVNKTVPNDKELHESLHWVQKGGWQPNNCTPQTKVALIIPYLNRKQNLHIFLRHIHPLLKKQNLAYEIFIIEQNNTEKPFNRGKLMNVGFSEAYQSKTFNCYIFHDVDLVAEDDRIDYSCPTSPRHMSVALDKNFYKPVNDQIFGGIVSFKENDFIKTNGFPNRYWGWGGEDDDMFQRVQRQNMTVKRPPEDIARFTMLTHTEAKKSPIRFKWLGEAKYHYDTDGLNTLSYIIVKYEERQLYTFISVQI